jgi:hypothetical protein
MAQATVFGNWSNAKNTSLPINRGVCILTHE